VPEKQVLFKCLCEQEPQLYPSPTGGVQYSCDNCEIRTEVVPDTEEATEAWNALIATKKIQLKITAFNIAAFELLPQGNFRGIIICMLQLDSFPAVRLELEIACTAQTKGDITWRVNVVRPEALDKTTIDKVSTVISSALFHNRINTAINSFMYFIKNLDLVKGRL